MPDHRCRRPGCAFQKRRTPHGRGWRQNCSSECAYWCVRARYASRNGDADEARELLRLAELLGGRRTPQDVVPGLTRDA